MIGRVQSLTRWFVIVALLAGAARAQAAPLSGTVRYNGSRGTVSVSTPIVLFLFTTPSPGDDNPQHFAVTTNGGSFNYDVAAGTYYLAFVLDLNGDGQASVSEPASIYNSRSSFPGDPIVAPRTGLTLQFNDTSAIPGIAGTITYTGHMGTVSDATRLRVDVFADADLTIPADAGGESKASSNPGHYDLIIFDHTPRYLCAYFDRNGNQQLDAEEPFQIYNARSDLPGDPVIPSTTQTNINFTISDPGAGNVTLTGTVHYTGSHGPVSASRPIQLILSSDSSFHGDNSDVDQTNVTTNPGNFTLHAPNAGDYYLAVILDVVPNGSDNNVNVGEPFQLFNGRFHFPADPLTLPRAGLTITFNDTGRLPGVAGTVTYSGALGQVDSNHKLIVRRFVDAALTQPADRDDEAEVDSNGGRYDFIGDIDTNTYYLMAFFDVNGNFQHDLGEPFQIYNNKIAPPASAVVAGPDTTNINFSFGDPPVVSTVTATPSQTPSPTLTPTPCTPLQCSGGEVSFCPGACPGGCGMQCGTPTPRPTLGPCIGDCGNDGAVTVEELIIGVNVALGIVPLSRCPSFDTDHSNDVTVDELIRGVNAALLGCVPVPTPTGTATATPTASVTVTNTDTGGTRTPTPTPSPSLTVTLTSTPTATTVPATPGRLARAVAGHAAIAADAFGAIPAVITAIATGFQLGGSSAVLGSAASDGGAAGACPRGGTVMRQCVPNGPGGVIIQFVFDPTDGCVIDTPDGVANLKGSISLSGSGFECVVLPPIAATAKLHVEFTHEDQSTLTVTADLSGIVATPNFEGSCFITAADLTLSGGLRTQLPDGRGASVDFSNTAVHAAIVAFDVNCIPLKYALTFNDSAQFTELASGEQFAATFDTFVFSQDATLNPVEVQLNGGVTSNCLGEQVTLATLTPMISRFGSLCFQGGALRADSSTAHERVVYLDGGGVGIDSNADGTIDESFDSCLVPELLLCP